MSIRGDYQQLHGSFSDPELERRLDEMELNEEARERELGDFFLSDSYRFDQQSAMRQSENLEGNKQ